MQWTRTVNDWVNRGEANPGYLVLVPAERAPQDDGSCMFPHCGCPLDYVTFTVGSTTPLECPRLS